MAVACINGELLTQEPKNRLEATGRPEPGAVVTQFPWFALQVRSRFEQGVADHLDGKGYE